MASKRRRASAKRDDDSDGDFEPNSSTGSPTKRKRVSASTTPLRRTNSHAKINADSGDESDKADSASDAGNDKAVAKASIKRKVAASPKSRRSDESLNRFADTVPKKTTQNSPNASIRSSGSLQDGTQPSPSLKKTVSRTPSFLGSPTKSISLANVHLSSGGSRHSNVLNKADPSTLEDRWKLKLLEGLVWVRLPLPRGSPDGTAKTGADSLDKFEKIRVIQGDEDRQGCWWPAELVLQPGQVYAAEPLQVELFIDKDREILKLCERKISINKASVNNILSFRSKTEVRVNHANFRQPAEGEAEPSSPLAMEPVAETAVRLAAPSTDAFVSARKFAMQRDADIEGLPDIEQASQITTPSVTNSSPSKKVKYYNPPTHLETADDVDIRISFPEKVLANWPNPGSKAPLYYPALLTGFNLPEPLSGTEEDTKRRASSLKITYNVAWPDGFTKSKPHIYREDFLTMSDSNFYDVKVGSTRGKWQNEPQQIVARVVDELGTLQEAIRGTFAPSQEAYDRFMSGTTAERYKQSTELVHTGEYSPDHTQAVLAYLIRWAQLSREDGDDIPPRTSGSEAFEALNNTDREYFVSSVLAPLAFERLALIDEPKIWDDSRTAHPDDQQACLMSAHSKAAEILQRPSWFAQIMSLLRQHAQRKEDQAKAKLAQETASKST